MKRSFVTTLAIAFALTGTTLAAQDRTSNGNTTGTAVPRGDGGGAVSRDSGSSSSSPSSGSSSGDAAGWNTGPSGSATGSSSAPFTWSTFEAPRRSSESAQGRTRGSGSSASGERAVPRGGGEPRGDSRGGDRDAVSTPSTSATASSGEAPTRRAVPMYSRPREGRPVTGLAVDRGSVAPPSGGGGGIIYYPYYPYNPWGFWGPGYSYGLGYLFYDPWYGSGWGYGAPYGYGGYGGYGGGYGGGGGYSVSQSSKDTGKLRLKIDPKDAEVYVDGFYVGRVDSFDGSFQKLELDAGTHRIELKATGYAPEQFEVVITPGETVTYKGDMKRVQ